MSELVRRILAPRTLVVVAVMSVPSRVHAQVPELDDHRFVPSTLVAWAFVDTEVSSTSEAGVTNFVFQTEPPAAASGLQVPSQLSGRFVEGTQTLAGSVAFGGIFALEARLSVDGLLPRDLVSAVVVGGNAAAGEAIGAAVRLVRTDAFQLALRADFVDAQVESVLPLRIPSNPRITGDIRGVHSALAGALAITRCFGLQGSVTVDWQRFDVNVQDDITSVAGGLAATLSLDSVPLTFLAGANVRHAFGRDVFDVTANAVFGPTRTDWNVEGGLYITVRKPLDIGLLFRAEVGGDDGDSRYHGEFRLGYYF